MQSGGLFPQILIEHAERKATGLLEIEAEGIRTGIFLHRGEPVFADRGRIGDTLGRMLVRMGRLDEEQYRRAIDVMTERIVDNESIRLGEVLIELGYVGPEEIFDALRQQVRRKILACFEWDELSWVFKEGESYLENVTKFRCGIDDLIVEGVTEHFDAGRTARFFATSLGRYPSLMRAPADVASRFRFGGPELRFMTALDGKKSLHTLLASSGHAETAHRVLLTSHFAGVLDLKSQAHVSIPPPASEPPPPPATVSEPPAGPTSKREREIINEYIRVTGGRDEDVLGLAPDASPEDVERAFQERSAAFAPEATSDLGQGTWKDRAGEVFSSMRRARDRIMEKMNQDISFRAPPSPEKRERVSAEKTFQLGRRYLDRGEHAIALREFEAACKVRPDELEYQLFETWCRFMLSTDEIETVTLKAKARELAIAMTKQDAKHAKAQYIVGHMLKLDGETEAAMRRFAQALKLDPKDVDAKRELRRGKRTNQRTKR